MPKEHRNNKISGWKVVDAPYSLASYLRRKARDLLSLQADEKCTAHDDCGDTVAMDMNDLEGEDEIKLPSEVWGMVLDCKCFAFILFILYMYQYIIRCCNTQQVSCFSLFIILYL